MVSCIITTYRRPVKVLKRALDSVINQTYEDTEIIIVNDAPEDKKLDREITTLISLYDKKIQYILPREHLGACQARNIGVEKAMGEYIAFLDDDDEWLPEKLEKQMECMKKEDVALVYSSHYFVSKSGKKRRIEEPLARKGIHKDEFSRLLRANFIGSTSSPLLRTRAVNTVGGFDKRFLSSQDHDLWLRIAREYNICYISDPLVMLYYGDHRISGNKKCVLQGYEYLLKKYAPFYEKDRNTYNYRLNYLALCSVSHGYGREFFKYWGRAVRVKWFSRYNLLILGRACAKIRYVLGNGELKSNV